MHIATGKRFENWCGYAFENLCLKHLDQLKRSLGISGIQSTAGTWSFQSRDSEPGAQIDLLIERADRCFNLVEAKFSTKPYVITKAFASELETKLRVFRAKNQSRQAYLSHLSHTIRL